MNIMKNAFEIDSMMTELLHFTKIASSQASIIWDAMVASGANSLEEKAKLFDACTIPSEILTDYLASIEKSLDKLEKLCEENFSYAKALRDKKQEEEIELFKSLTPKEHERVMFLVNAIIKKKEGADE